MSAQDTLIPKKRRGPPPTGHGTPVMVRLQPDQLAAVDEWIERKGGELSRPEAIRSLVAIGIKHEPERPSEFPTQVQIDPKP